MDSHKHMLNLSASQAAKKALDELLKGIAAAMNLTPGQAKFMLMLGWALLAFCLFYHLRRYVLAAPEVPAEETFQTAGKPRASQRRLYAVVGLVSGVLCLILGYGFDDYGSPLPTIGWLLITTSLLAMWIISLLDGRHDRDGTMDTPTEDDQDPLATYALISLVAGMIILIQGLVCLVHAEKAERIRAAEAARNAPAKPWSFKAKPSPGANDPSNPKKMKEEDFAQALEYWRKKSSQQTQGKKAGGEPAKAPGDSAQEKTVEEKPAPAAK